MITNFIFIFLFSYRYMGTSDDIRWIIKEFDSECEKDPYIASDDKNSVPVADAEESVIEQEKVIEQAEEYNSDEIEDEPVSQNFDSWVAKDRTKWRVTSLQVHK